jgi:hypothetical protein
MGGGSRSLGVSESVARAPAKTGGARRPLVDAARIDLGPSLHSPLRSSRSLPEHTFVSRPLSQSLQLAVSIVDGHPAKTGRIRKLHSPAGRPKCRYFRLHRDPGSPKCRQLDLCPESVATNLR